MAFACHNRALFYLGIALKYHFVIFRLDARSIIGDLRTDLSFRFEKPGPNQNGCARLVFTCFDRVAGQVEKGIVNRPMIELPMMMNPNGRESILFLRVE